MFSDKEIKLFNYFHVEVHKDDTSIFWVQKYTAAIINAFLNPYIYKDTAQAALRAGYAGLCLDGLSRNTPEYEELITW